MQNVIKLENIKSNLATPEDLEDIGKIFNGVKATIRTILNKNWPEWGKHSTTTLGRKPGSSIGAL